MRLPIVSFLAIGVGFITVLFSSVVGLGGVPGPERVKGVIKPMLLNLFFIKITLSPLSSHSPFVDFIDSQMNISIPEVFSTNKYSVYLWSYCTQTQVSTTCTAPQNRFSFDPVQVWQLEEQQLPSILITSLETYKTVTGYIGTLYLLALVCALSSQIVGICSVFRPKLLKKPLFPFLLSFAACVLLLVASVVITITFSTLFGIFKTAFQGTGVDVEFGKHVFALIWVAFGSSFLAAGLWFLSLLIHFCLG